MCRIFILMLIIMLSLLSCGDGDTVTEATDESESITEITEVAVDRISGESLLLRAVDNPMLGCDIVLSEINGELYMFLPGSVADTSLKLTALDSDGTALETQAIELSDGIFTLVTSSGERKVNVMISSLPAIFLELDESKGTFADMEASADKSASCYGKLTLTSESGTLISEDARLRGRGNWTWLRDKKGYALKLSNKESLLGMDASKNWVLLANVADTTLMRNLVSFKLAAEMGLPFSPECTPVELYINGEYRGSYVLSEKTEIAASRIDIYDLEKETESLNPGMESYSIISERIPCGAQIKYAAGIIEPEDVSGGYLLEFELPDRYTLEPCGFVTSRGICFVVKSPEWAGKRQVSYIAELYQQIEDALFASDGIDPASGLHYTELVDLTSAARKYALEELSKNFDANHSSQYSYKPRNDQSSLVFFGPVWDMDATFGNTEDTWSYDGWWAATGGWWAAFMSHDDFRAEVKRILHDELLPLCRELIDGGIDEYESILAPSAAMNFIRWKHMGVKPTESTYIATGTTYAESVEQLRDFLERRADWLAEKFGV